MARAEALRVSGRQSLNSLCTELGAAHSWNIRAGGCPLFIDQVAALSRKEVPIVRTIQPREVLRVPFSL